MREPREPAETCDQALDAIGLEVRLRGMPGLATLVREAEATWRGRAVGSGEPDPAVPGWRTFEDAFPTFYEFTNRPR